MSTLFDTILGQLPTTLTAGAGAAADFFTGKEVAGATEKANLANIQAQKDMQQTALDASTGATPFSTITRSEGGGFDTTQPGGAEAAQARTTLALGDVGRAQDINELSRNFGYTIPTLDDARGIINAQQALINRSVIDPALDRITAGALRRDRDKNPLLQGDTVRALREIADQGQIGGPQAALDLYFKSGEADRQRQASGFAAANLQAPAPGFTDRMAGANVAQAIGQTTPTQRVPNLTDAAGPANASSFLRQIQEQLAREQSRKDQMALLDRFIQSQPGFSGKPSGPVTPTMTGNNTSGWSTITS